MRFHNITHDDMLNGTGLRVVLWVAGCEHHCPGCQNSFTWNPDYGQIFAEWEECEIWNQFNKPFIKGISFSGGDPLYYANREEIGILARKIKELMPQKDIWLYTGYELNVSDGEKSFRNIKTGETFKIDWIDCIDIIVDRPFEEDTRKKDLENKTSIYWAGSSNQRVIDVKASMTEIVELAGINRK